MKKSALVLSGGGALGIAHVGAISVLEKTYKFEWYAGVSAGAIIASLLALGNNAAQVNKILKSTNILNLMFDFHPTQFGLVSGRNIEDTLEEIFEDTQIEDLNTPLYIGTTDFSTGEQVIITSGRLTDAVRASISVPVMFEPYWHEEEDRWLVDGGLSQNFPLDSAMTEYKGKRIIGIDVGSSIDTHVDFGKRNFWKRGDNIKHAFIRSIRIMFQNQKSIKPDDRVILLEPNVGKYLATDIAHYDKLKQAGYRCAKAIQ